ncbi:Potassium transporter 2 isoform 1 [Hibiscus syriacus]|uniref:Potassium transporter 2 isoform 1 n=1 Tax=Hibiscus syriacus TaxID=106335 RepID=A0A6A2XUW6_HIBSY|nr:Potassium transporter 2 isoform 1 [Hibiscus syriacus]
MAKKELKNPSFLLLFALLLLLTTSSQCRAEGIGRLSSSTKTTRKVLELEQDYPGDVPSTPSDYDYNDFYRRQGDVPSPGIGH